MDLNFDFNDRERKRFSGNLRELAKFASEAADALEANENEKLLKAHLFVSINFVALKEMNDIVSAGIMRGKTDFPEFIKEF